MAQELPEEFTTLASELIVALRGRRSQRGLSRRLGYRSNIVQRWERGRCWPTGAKFMELCTRVGVDLRAALTRFCGRKPAWLVDADLTNPAAVAALLRELRGKTPIGSLAADAGCNRYTVSRWLKGAAQPRLPELLLLIEASSHRIVDFIAALTDPNRVPSLRERHRQLIVAREAAFTSPWSHGVLRAMELTSAQANTGDPLQVFAQALGVDVARVQAALAVLEESGQVKRDGARLVPGRVAHVNTGAEPTRARALKGVWTAVAQERLTQGHPGLYGYSLFAVSRADLRRLRDLQLQYLQQMRSLIAGSRRSECVGLYCAQLLDLAKGPGNALADSAEDGT